jgi:hypothetical protein
MEAAASSEILVNTYNTTHYYNPENASPFIQFEQLKISNATS